MSPVSSRGTVDVALVGGGIMSATVGTLLRQLEPGWSIEVFERLDDVALESSGALNNAGTGHSALCELNYTPERPDGTVDVSRALGINAQFQVSRQLWAALVERGCLPAPGAFIHEVPHVSFVRGQEDAAFLARRFAALRDHPLFEGMEHSSDRRVLHEWMPLVMEGRDPAEPVAATRARHGTDVDFGALTRGMLATLARTGPGAIRLRHEVRDLRREDGGWRLAVRDRAAGATRDVRARFVFLGAGGRALTLLLRSGIPEARGYGGFPVSGMWLVCTNPAVIARHDAKVYGKPRLGAPPMSVPHLDTRVVAGRRGLLFGPYAGFSTKFLRRGSYLDLFASVRPGNVVPMVLSAAHNLRLLDYLVREVLQSPEGRVRTLREHYPGARAEDWRLSVAGQRVQVIHEDPATHTYLQFGTDVVCSADGTLSALLGASPGASTSVSIALDLLRCSFPERFAGGEWRGRLQAMIPSFGRSLHDDPGLCRRVRRATAEVLGLER